MNVHTDIRVYQGYKSFLPNSIINLPNKDIVYATYFNVLDVLLFLQEELRKIPDFSRLAKKFQRQKASLQVIYSTINNI